MRVRLGLFIVAALLVPAIPAQADGPTARLIGVHHMRPAPDQGKPRPSGANCVNDGAPSVDFALTGWVVSGTRTAHLNTGSVPSSLGSLASTLQASYDAWTGTPHITVATDGTVNRQTANRQDDLMFGRSGSSIATTYTWLWTDGQIESDVVFNKGLAWFNAESEGDGCYELVGAYDVANIAVHEFGHVYGLDHSPGRFATMYAYGFTGETLKRTPGDGDVKGIAAAY
jgi:hypothetical protein